MSLQWTLVSLFLYSEVLFVIALLIPGISPKKWLAIFNSRFTELLNRKAHIFFNFTIIVLSIFLLDAIREICRYGADSDLGESMKSTLDVATSAQSSKELRSQRNLYITGMSLFMWFVIKRLVVLISRTASLEDDFELADRECRQLRRELELAQIKYNTFTAAMLNQETTTMTTNAGEKGQQAVERAERVAEKAAEGQEKVRSRSRGKKEI